MNPKIIHAIEALVAGVLTDVLAHVAGPLGSGGVLDWHDVGAFALGAALKALPQAIFGK